MKRAATAIVLLALAACGAPPRVEAPHVETLYRGLEDPLPPTDAHLLSGFSVLIDPGHGGSFHGTVGPDSLQEAQVNLGVALYLWGLLHEAGAEVSLTRASDRDFLTTDSTLTSDLQARVDMADSLHPDVFISIHHNAQPQRDPTMNRVETYYKAGDPASLDLAFAIHRHLMRNLGIDVGEVRQGNYFVLRNVGVPAVLGESSYLTHPVVEEKLKLSQSQQLEAESYFLGIVDYCRRGIPRVVTMAPRDSLQTSVPVVTGSFEDRGGLGIDPDGVTMLINGEPVDAVLSDDGHRATFRLPWDAPNGHYDVRLSARNLRGNTSATGRLRFRIEHPPTMAAIDPSPARVTAGGGSVRVRARILDRRGMPVADGTPVTMTSSADKASTTGSVQDGAVVFALEVPRGARRPVHITLDCRGARFSAELLADAGKSGPSRSVAVRDAVSGAPVVDATIIAGDSVLAAGSPSGTYGFATLDVPTRARAPGYRPAVVMSTGDVALAPWFGGALLGKRFVVDPQGGTPRDAGVGAMGLASSYVNLRVAVYLAGFLHMAGAQTRLTRSSEEVRLPEDIARMTNRFRADAYIELRHPGEPADSVLAVRSYYFPGSANGQKMARTIGAAMARHLACNYRGPSELVTYPLQQTACPAIVVAAPAISNADEELRLNQPGYLREQAYALFIGILRQYGVQDAGTLTVNVTLAEPRDWMVTLDDSWTLATGENGRVIFEAVPPGAHDLVIRRGADYHSSRVVTTLDGERAEFTLDGTD